MIKKYGAPSVKKAFAILSAISSSKDGLGVSELAKNLKMAKSTVHGMTSATLRVWNVKAADGKTIHSFHERHS